MLYAIIRQATHGDAVQPQQRNPIPQSHNCRTLRGPTGSPINLSWLSGTSQGDGKKRGKVQNRPTQLYHGCPNMQAAYDIYHNQIFKIGGAVPYGAWLTPDFNFASGYTGGGNGAIIEFYVPPHCLLSEPKNRQYVAESGPGSKGQYFKFSEIQSVAMWKPDRRRIA